MPDLLDDDVPRGNRKKPGGNVPGEVFEDHNELAAAYPHDGENLIAGAVGEELIGEKTEQGRLVIAGAGGGKTVELTVEAITYEGSMVILDPKGSVLRATGKYRAEELGHECYAFTPGLAVEPELEPYCCQWNPLSHRHCDPAQDDFLERIGLITDAFIIHSPKAEPHWTDSAKTLFEGLLILTKICPLFEGKRHLITSYRLLTRGLGLEERIENKEEEEHQEAEPENIMAGVIELMLHTSKFQRECYPVAAAALEAAAHDFWDRPENERGSVLSTARTQLKILSYSAMQEIFGVDGEGQE